MATTNYLTPHPCVLHNTVFETCWAVQRCPVVSTHCILARSQVWQERPALTSGARTHRGTEAGRVDRSRHADQKSIINAAEGPSTTTRAPAEDTATERPTYSKRRSDLHPTVPLLPRARPETTTSPSASAPFSRLPSIYDVLDSTMFWQVQSSQRDIWL